MSVFGFRKNVGPDSAALVWPAHSVPDFLWWHVQCQTSTAGGYLDAAQVFADELLRHREPARFGWARARGPKRWADRAADLLPHAGRTVADEAADELLTRVLADVAGQAVPFGGLVTVAVRKAAGKVVEAGDRQQRLVSDTMLGTATGGREDPTDTLAAVIHSLALPGFPVVVAVEDVHDADPGLLGLLRRLAGPGYADRLLVLATGWPGALASRTIGGVPLGDWLRDLGAHTIDVDPLPDAAVHDLVGAQFPGTGPDRRAAVARRWTNPLAVGVVLDLLAGDGGVVGDAIVADDEMIAEIPPDLEGLYNLQFSRLPEAARRAVILDVICGADPGTAADYRRPPGPDAAWNPVERNWVTVAAGHHRQPPEGIDHDTAVAVGWLAADQDWVTPREPGLAGAAWRAIYGHGLRAAAPAIRAQAARVLAEAINAAAQHEDGTPGLFLGTDRWWLRESAWMIDLAGAAPEDPDVQAAAARAALELFGHKARTRPQEALREWAGWATRWDAILGPDHPVTLTSRNNLAVAHASAGDLARAIDQHEQTLADRQRVLGPDHPDSLNTRNNLAMAHQQAGDHRRAIPQLEAVL